MSRILALVALLCVLAAPTTRAQTWAIHNGSQVDPVRLEGVSSELATAIRKGLALTPRSKLLGKKRSVLDSSKVEADRARILLYLARRGYPTARVDVRVETTSERRRVRVVFVVDPGTAVRVGQVELRGVDETTGESLSLLLQRIAPGSHFVDADAQAVRSAMRAALEDAGFARSQVDLAVSPSADARVDVVYTVRTGPRYRFGEIQVQGVSADLEALAREEIGLESGDLYRPATLRGVRDDLRSLGLFQQVNVSTTPTDSTTLRVLTTLAPRRMRTLEFSVGTWSDHPIQVDALWRHRNLLRRGRGVLAETSLAYRRQEAAVALQWPSLLARRSVSEWRFEYQIHNEEAYDLRVGMARWSNLFRTGKQTSVRVGISLLETSLRVSGDDPDLFDVEPGRQVVLNAQWYEDGVDDPLDPTRGWRLLAEGGWAPPIGITDAPFVSLRGMVSRVQPVVRGATLAARGDVAWATPLGDAQDLLPSQRWFAGGYNTMRGSARRGLGPADDGADPIGGELRILTGAELRMPVRGIFGLSLFTDAGQVWSEPGAAGWRSLAVAVGGGLLLYTPIGPVHIEVARNVGRLPIDGNHYQIQLGIGHPY